MLSIHFLTPSKWASGNEILSYYIGKNFRSPGLRFLIIFLTRGSLGILVRFFMNNHFFL